MFLVFQIFLSLFTFLINFVYDKLCKMVETVVGISVAQDRESFDAGHHFLANSCLTVT